MCFCDNANDTYCQVVVSCLQPNELACLMGHSDRVVSVTCGANNTICTGSADRTVKVWRPDLEEAYTPRGHNAPVTATCWPDRCNRYVLTGSGDGVLKLWTVKNGVDGLTAACTVKVGLTYPTERSHSIFGKSVLFLRNLQICREDGEKL